MRWFFVLLLFSANVFAVQTRIEIIIDGSRRIVYGGAMACGLCGFGMGMMPLSPLDSAKERCPRCNYAGDPR